MPESNKDLFASAFAELKKGEAEKHVRLSEKKEQSSSKDIKNLVEEFQKISTGAEGEERLEKMLKSDGLGVDEEGMDMMIEQMMKELTSKDLLGDPFDSMAKAYPKWLEANSGGTEAQQQQCKIIIEIDELFKKSEGGERIFALMQEMQELGEPPEDMMKEIGMSGQETKGSEEASIPDCSTM